MKYLTFFFLVSATAVAQQVSHIILNSITSKLLQPNKELDIHFYVDFSSHKIRVYSSHITTLCETLPKLYWNKISLIKAEKCVLLFSLPNCEGSSIQAEAGSKDLKTLLKNELVSFRSCDDVNNKIQAVRQYKLEKKDWGTLEHVDDLESIMPWNNSEVTKSPTGIRLSVSIFNFVVEAEGRNVSTNDLVMGSKQTFRNNGGATIKEKYSVSKEITEMISVEKVIGNSYTQSYSVEGEAGIEFGGSLHFIDPGAKFTAALRKTYSNETTNSNSSIYTYETKTSFSVEKDVDLPPCREYGLVSKIRVSKGAPLRYTALALITGDNNGEKISASEIKEKLPNDMTYVRDRDENTVEVEFINIMTADVGLEIETVGDGTPIDGCVDGCDIDGGYFEAASGVCKKCSDACLTCNGSGDDKCILCKKGVENNGKCVESCPFDMENIRGACKDKENVYVAGVGGVIALVLGVGFGIVFLKMRSNKENNTTRKQKYIAVGEGEVAINNYFKNSLNKPN